MQDRITDFVTLFVVVDPIGSLPIFLAATATLTAAARLRAALLSVLIAFGVLLFFVVGGQFQLDAMNISLRAFQIAGGIVLFLFAVTMVLGSEHAQPAGPPRSADVVSLAIFPVAIPSIAGPGAMLAVVLLTDNERLAIADQATTVAALALVLVMQLAILLLAEPIARLIGDGGANVVRRVMGMILAAVAANMALTALGDWLGLPKL